MSLIMKLARLPGILLFGSILSLSACVQDFGPVGLLNSGVLGVLRPGTAYGFSTLPAQLSIPVPKTLSAQTIATTTGLTNLNVTSCAASSFGYEVVREIVANFRQVTKEAYREMMVVDGLIPKVRADYPANTCVTGGTYSLVWTAAMRESIFSSMTDAGLSPALAESFVLELEQFEFIPKVGESVPSPAMQYQANQNGYDHELRYAFSPYGMKEVHTCDDVAGSYDSVLRWNQNRMRFQLGYSETFGSDTFSGILTLNLDTKTMFFREAYDFAGDRYTRNAGLSSCTGPRCVLLNVTEMISIGASDESFRMDGKADDNGGYVRTVYTYDDGASTDYYKEYFGAGGAVLGMQESTDDITYTTVSGCESFDYDDEDYDSGSNVDVGLNVSAVATGCAGDCQFVIVPGGVNPNSNPEAIIGAGGRINANVFIDYWGEAGAELNNADIWEITGYSGGLPVYGPGATGPGNLSAI